MSNVESYSSISGDVDGAKIYIVPSTGQDTKSLLWKQNKSVLVHELNAFGFSETDNADKADFIAYFGYAVDEGKLVTTNYAIPHRGITGYSEANTSGTFSGNTYSETTTLTPIYGVTGYSVGSRTDKVFTRSATLFLVDKSAQETVFEGTASSTGSCHAFAPVAPYIIRAILTNFPNGKVGRVTLGAGKLDC